MNLVNGLIMRLGACHCMGADASAPNLCYRYPGFYLLGESCWVHSGGKAAAAIGCAHPPPVQSTKAEALLLLK